MEHVFPLSVTKSYPSGIMIDKRNEYSPDSQKHDSSKIYFLSTACCILCTCMQFVDHVQSYLNSVLLHVIAGLCCVVMLRPIVRMCDLGLGRSALHVGSF